MVEHQMTSYGWKILQKQKNHIQMNVSRMRAIQRMSGKNAIHKENKPMTAFDLWKSSKYDQVESRVFQNLKEPPSAPRPKSAGFLRAHSLSGYTPPPRPVSARSEISPDKLTVPLASSVNKVDLKRSDVNFILLNGRGAKKANIKRSPSETNLHELKMKEEDTLKKYHKGEIPKYLKERFQRQNEDKRQQKLNAPDPDTPAGHRKLPDNERRETLRLVLEAKEKYLRQLNTMPIRTDTFRVRTQKQELERLLAESEETIRVFSKPKVYVKMSE